MDARSPGSQGAPPMSTLAGIILLVGRILFVALFVIAARGHIKNHPRYVEGSGKKLPFPILAGWPAGVFLLVAAISIVAGIWADVGSLMIAVFLVPAAVLFHPFWNEKDPTARRTHEMSFYRDVSLLGAALALFALFAASGHVPFALTGPALNLR
jgi:putative oxidoreductase